MQIKTRMNYLTIITGLIPNNTNEVFEIDLANWGIVFNEQYPQIKIKKCGSYFLETNNQNIKIFNDGRFDI